VESDCRLASGQVDFPKVDQATNLRLDVNASHLAMRLGLIVRVFFMHRLIFVI
jgi:hypothetical protein